MTVIDIFTTKEFENALPKHKTTNEPLWFSMGVVTGEYQYRLPVRKDVEIIIRSSIKEHTGQSASKGKDSIRMWLVDSETGKPFGSKISSYVTRVKGWEYRMVVALRTLYKRGSSYTCPNCDKPVPVFKVKKNGKNKGKLFASCNCKKYFKWIKEEK